MAFIRSSGATRYARLMRIIALMTCLAAMLAVPTAAQAHAGHSHSLQLPSGRTVKSTEQSAATAAPAGTARAKVPTASYVLGGPAWRKRVLTYYDATPPGNYRTGVAKAIAEWNSRGTRMTFRKTTSKRNADFVIMVDRKISPGGLATVGYWGRNSYWVKLNMAGYRWDDVAWVASHELGHIYGLGHSRGCAVMSYAAYDACKWPEKSTHWRCRLQERDDLNGIKRLYGGSFRLRTNPFCLLNPASGAVTGVSVVQAAEPNFATIAWQPAARAVGGYRIARSAANGPCPTDPNGSYVADVKGLSYTEENSTYQPLGAGVYCYTVWSMNVNRYVNPASAGKASFTYVVPPVPVPVVTSVSAVFSGYTDPVYPEYNTLSWDVNLAATAPAGTDGVIYQAHLGACTLTDPAQAVGGMYGGTARDYVDAYSMPAATHGSSLCYRFWTRKYDGGYGTPARYSAPVDVAVTLP